MTLTTNHEEQKKIGNKYILPFIPKKNLKDEGIKKREHLRVSSWTEMSKKSYPERKVLISNLIHDREAIMLYSPTGVGKTWLSLAMGMICAGGGRLDLLEWKNDAPQPVVYVDGEMFEEDIRERMNLLIPSLNLDEEKLKENFHYIKRGSARKFRRIY